MNQRLIADSALLFVVFIWGTTFAVMKGIFTTVSPLYFLTLRFSFATLVLVAIFYQQLKNVNWEIVKKGTILGWFLFGGFAFQVVGLKYTTASKAGFLTGLAVVLVPIFSALIFKRMPQITTIVGVSLATIGLGLLTYDGGFLFSFGDGLVFLCAVSLALHILLVDKYVREEDTALLTIVQLVTVAVLGGIATGIEGGYQIITDISIWGSIIYMGVFASAFAFIIQTWAQNFTTPTRTGIIFSLEPVFAALFAYLYLGETITTAGYIGGSLIILSMLLVEIKFKKLKAIVNNADLTA